MHFTFQIIFHIIIFPSNSCQAAAAAAAKSLQLCPTLCGPIDGSPPGSPVPGILQARTLEWVAISFCMKVKSESEVAQLCPTLHNPMDCSLPGSSAHGIFQARVLEWGAIAFSMLKAELLSILWLYLLPKWYQSALYGQTPSLCFITFKFVYL